MATRSDSIAAEHVAPGKANDASSPLILARQAIRDSKADLYAAKSLATVLADALDNLSDRAGIDEWTRQRLNAAWSVALSIAGKIDGGIDLVDRGEDILYAPDAAEHLEAIRS